jgi:hypothetical protein
LRYFFILFLWIGHSAFAQSTDTIQVYRGSFTRFDTSGIEYTNMLDSSLTDFHLGSLYYTQQAKYFNRGLTSSNAYAIDEPNNLQSWENAFPYVLRVSGQEFYQVTQAITRLYYSNASLKEQWFGLLHTQNISPNANVSLEFNRNDSKGFYVDQKLNYTGCRLGFSVFSKNKKWGLFGSSSWNRIRQKENGGMLSDSLFLDETITNPLFENVLLTDAQSFTKLQSYGIRLYRDLGSTDTLKTTKDTLLSFHSKWRIMYVLEYDQWKLGYKDNQFVGANWIYNGLDTNAYFDGLSFRDSVFTAKVSQEITLGKLMTKHWSFSAGVEHQYLYKKQFSNQNFASDAQTLGIVQYANWNPDSSWTIQEQFRLGSIFTLNNYVYSEVALNVNKEFKKWQFGIDISVRNTPQSALNFNLIHPTIYMDTLTSIQQTNIKVLHKNSGLSLGFRYQSHQNFIFSVVDSSLAQSVEMYPNFNLVQWNIGYHKESSWAGLNANFLLNQASQASILPNMFARVNPYLKFKIRKVLKANIGLDVWYWDLQNLAVFNPVYQQFALSALPENRFVQFTSPLSNVYVSASLKRAKFFVAYQFINKDLLNQEGYYQVYRNPQPLSYLKLGLTWDMMN